MPDPFRRGLGLNPTDNPDFQQFLEVVRQRGGFGPTDPEVANYLATRESEAAGKAAAQPAGEEFYPRKTRQPFRPPGFGGVYGSMVPQALRGVEEVDPSEPAFRRSEYEGLPPEQVPEPVKAAQARQRSQDTLRAEAATQAQDKERNAYGRQRTAFAEGLKGAGFREEQVAGILNETATARDPQAQVPTPREPSPAKAAPAAGAPAEAARAGDIEGVAGSPEAPRTAEAGGQATVPAAASATKSGQTGAKSELEAHLERLAAEKKKLRARQMVEQGGRELAEGLAGIGGARVKLQPGAAETFAKEDLAELEEKVTPEEATMFQKYGLTIPVGTRRDLIPQLAQFARSDRQMAHETELARVKAGAKRPGRPASESAIKDLSQLDTEIESLEEVMAEKEREGYLTGPIDERVARVGEMFDANPKRAAWKAKLSGVTNSIINRFSGANVPPAEFARLKQSIGLPTDNDETLMAKLQVMVAETKRLREKYGHQLEAAGRSTGGGGAAEEYEIPEGDTEAIEEAERRGVPYRVVSG